MNKSRALFVFLAIFIGTLVGLSASSEPNTAHNELNMKRWPERQGKIDLCTFPAQLLQKLISGGRSKSLSEEKDLSSAGKGSLVEQCSVFGFMEHLCPDEWAPDSRVLHR